LASACENGERGKSEEVEYPVNALTKRRSSRQGKCCVCIIWNLPMELVEGEGEEGRKKKKKKMPEFYYQVIIWFGTNTEYRTHWA
jgi:hypothetical protein